LYNELNGYRKKIHSFSHARLKIQSLIDVIM